MKLLIPLVCYCSRKRCCVQLSRSFKCSAVKTDQGASAPVSKEERGQVSSTYACMNIAFCGTASCQHCSCIIYIYCLYMYIQRIGYKTWLERIMRIQRDMHEMIKLYNKNKTSRICVGEALKKIWKKYSDSSVQRWGKRKEEFSSILPSLLPFLSEK